MATVDDDDDDNNDDGVDDDDDDDVCDYFHGRRRAAPCLCSLIGPGCTTLATRLLTTLPRSGP